LDTRAHVLRFEVLRCYSISPAIPTIFQKKLGLTYQNFHKEDDMGNIDLVESAYKWVLWQIITVAMKISK